MADQKLNEISQVQSAELADVKTFRGRTAWYIEPKAECLQQISCGIRQNSK